MSETRKIPAIWSRMWSAIAGSRARTKIEPWRDCARCCSDLIDPTISSASRPHRQAHRLDGSVIEFPPASSSAVRCALEVQHAMVERDAGVALDKRIEFRIGIHLGDVVEESDGDLMGDGVNIAARLERIAALSARSACPRTPTVEVSGRLDMASHGSRHDAAQEHRERSIRVYSLQVERPPPKRNLRLQATPAEPKKQLGFGAARGGDCHLAHPDRGWGVVFP